MSDIYLVVYAAVYGPSGYSELSRNLVLGLDKLGVKIKLISNMVYEMHEGILSDEVAEKLKSLENTRIPHNIIPPKICIGIAPWFDVKHPGHKIGYTMYEFDNVPSVAKYDWRAACLSVDEVWVPSSFNHNTFKNNGISNVSVFPPVIDTEKFKRREKEECMFNFLAVGEYTFRKGWDLLIPAYLEEFSFNDNVALTIKAFNNDKLVRQSEKQILEDVERYKSECGKGEDCARIYVVTDIIDSDDMPSLYNRADVFVLFTRGEGFGLPMAEAMACEVPCIVPANSSYLDFVDNSNGWIFDVGDFSKEEELEKISISYVGAPSPTIDIESGKRAMRYAFQHPEEALRRGIRARATIIESFSQKNAEAVYERLKEIGYKEKDDVVEIDDNFEEIEFDDYQVTKFIESERRCIRSLKVGEEDDLKDREDYAHDMVALMSEFDKEIMDEIASVDPNNKLVIKELRRKQNKTRAILNSYLSKRGDKNGDVQPSESNSD